MIRVVEPKDLSALLLLARQYLAFYHTKVDQEDLRKWAEYFLMHPQEGFFCLSEQDGQAIGFATVYLSWSTLSLGRIAVLNDLFITESWRGQGHGEKLFQFVASLTKDRGVVRLEWETTVGNKRAQALYAKMGGVVSDILTYTLTF